VIHRRPRRFAHRLMALPAEAVLDVGFAHACHCSPAESEATQRGPYTCVVASSEQERVRQARIRARELGYNLLLKEALNVEPVTHMASAAPHVPDTAVVAFFVAYGMSPGDAAEQGVVVLEIVVWFRGQGATLRLEHEPDGSWRAPVIPDGSQVAYVIQGVGSTSLEAANDAKRRWEAGEHRGKMTVQIGTAIETSEAMPITARRSVPTEKIEIPADFIEKLGVDGQAVVWTYEPDGRVHIYRTDIRTGEIIRSVVENNLIDAYLEMGVDFRPPSPEGREGPAGDATDPRA
jgi:hypothetical protein